MSYLTNGDQLYLKLGQRHNGGFHYATQWYFGFDPLPYQYAVHHTKQKNITLLAGIASGKTAMETASAAFDCMSIPYFRCLSTSVTAKQAELGFAMLQQWIEGNPKVERHIHDISLRPWPIVKFKNFSEWEFRTAGQNAKFIRGHEYDRILYDEAGLDYLGESVKTLRGRLRGTRPNGTKRMARMDVFTSPTDAPWLIERFNRGWKEHELFDQLYYLSFRIRTRMNTFLTEEQIALMEAEYSDDIIDVEMNGMFPDFGRAFLPRKQIISCTDMSLNDTVTLAMHPEDPKDVPKRGYNIVEHPRHGILKWERPVVPTGKYVMAGDPGTDNPPKNNAGVVTVFDVATNPARMVYFDWVSGNGSYMPFLSSFKYAMRKYKPSIKYLDTTGTQKAIDELAFEQMDMEVDPCNFTRDKDAALNSLSLGITNHEIAFPMIKGLDRQLSAYTKEDDRNKSFPKDITMTMAMAALAIRYASDNQEIHNSGKPNYSPSRRARGRRRRR
jgi:hypothetical protein